MKSITNLDNLTSIDREKELKDVDGCVGGRHTLIRARYLKKVVSYEEWKKKTRNKIKNEERKILNWIGENKRKHDFTTRRDVSRIRFCWKSFLSKENKNDIIRSFEFLGDSDN